jgi:hypothetical protein
MLLAVLLLIIALLFMRNLVGFIFTAGFGILLFIAALRLASRQVALVLLALGITSALYALLDIRSDIFRRPGSQSDAFMLAQLTGVPTLAWGVIWVAVAGLACWLASKRWLQRV